MNRLTPLDQGEVKDLVTEWFRKLDVHAPMVEILPMLAQEGLSMKFPEGSLHSLAEFEGWYQGVIRLFFDEVHQVTKCDVTISGDRANVDLIVKWEASVWKPPAAHSDRIMLDAYQTWTVEPCPGAGRPVIVRYDVDKLKYHDGSAKL
ncbi:MAG: hypothetical protein KKC20_06985 [Proteobacteria bacterium]|nr:hypothetical protein [Pseudomonadota bacterium]